tara:strand:- start:1362 stop:1604 length:243 start_codon:yes stop_codon:yes gene_type:complete
MAKKKEGLFQMCFRVLISLFGILIGLLAIVAVKSIFENDSSKIISKKGQKMLLDDKKMNEINRKIERTELDSQHNEILIV